LNSIGKDPPRSACFISNQSNYIIELSERYLKPDELLFVYEGVASRPDTNVVDWNADQFLYPLHVATSSFWEITVISY
jgi:hypothetical protein